MFSFGTTANNSPLHSLRCGSSPSFSIYPFPDMICNKIHHLLKERFISSFIGLNKSQHIFCFLLLFPLPVLWKHTNNKQNANKVIIAASSWILNAPGTHSETLVNILQMKRTRRDTKNAFEMNDNPGYTEDRSWISCMALSPQWWWHGDSALCDSCVVHNTNKTLNQAG